MTKQYQKLAFTDAVRAAQARNGSAHAYSADKIGNPPADVLGEDERAFIESRDSFYMATVSSSGWPYIQHRGGPPGFVKVTGPTQLMMPDYRGNRQYVSIGNLTDNNRASLFFMDYPRQARLKIYATIAEINLEDRPELADALAHDHYQAKIERALEFSVEAFEWNCPQHITPRYTEADIRAVTHKLSEKIRALEAENTHLRAKNTHL